MLGTKYVCGSVTVENSCCSHRSQSYNFHNSLAHLCRSCMISIWIRCYNLFVRLCFSIVVISVTDTIRYDVLCDTMPCHVNMFRSRYVAYFVRFMAFGAHCTISTALNIIFICFLLMVAWCVHKRHSILGHLLCCACANIFPFINLQLWTSFHLTSVLQQMWNLISPNYGFFFHIKSLWTSTNSRENHSTTENQ